MDPPKQDYILATGEAASIRLRLLDEIFGPSTRELLRTAGLAPGCRAADIGCGTGLVAAWMATQVGSGGSVVGVDSSGEQLRVAESHAADAGLQNITFHTAGAYDTGLPRDFFDLAYSRFLICHLTRPVDALREMRALLRPGGVLVCEDFDAGGISTDPPTRAYTRLVEISRAVHAALGGDADVGLKLHRLFREAGFASPEVAVKQIALQRGEGKRFWELTLREAASAIIESGAATAEEIDSLCAEMRAIARDETTLLLLTRVTQVCARKT